ncbi:ABC transporter ATP-binding protein [Sneathiella sp. CAU 1612]|jgi:peptide/nickel transport system ATP-binding protein|uniref:ABC transporter ATP-binding protein n=1 Tax=Sneathiella sedimenti TaxID=2816034 RepID=A0ABS3F0M6_9PROT|nr:ABC transporter ATP-binding protein [Sneathiella sedimenti]MBO0332062.1 ABC transporter ATP-binding protein [Sneathiella sedimenti]
MSLLSVKNLSVILATNDGPARAVRNLNFRLNRGETLGIVGESGCGKSMAALALMGLLPERSETEGEITLDGENLLEKSDAEMCRIRGNRLAMIFQEPMTSLNPVHTVGNQIMEPLQLHRNMSDSDARAETLRLLDRVGIPNPKARIDNYPHQLSGGQRQRVMIAIALSCQPDILIADEPTTALDVTIQDQILELIQTLVREEGMSLILISHDLGVISENTDNILVMYGGAAVEMGSTAQIFDELIHPYTQGLFAAMPKLGRARARRLVTIPGTVPDLISLPAGCTFTDRCPLATDICRNTVPPNVEVKAKHFVACHHLDEARHRKTEELFS